MSAAEADPVKAASAVSATTNFFIFNPSVLSVRTRPLEGCVRTDSRNPVSGLYVVPPKMLLRQQHTRPKTSPEKTRAKRAYRALAGRNRPETARKTGNWRN